MAALYHFTDRVTVWGAANSGFRAPTLTELYRQFSVGAVTTRPNDQLGPERLVGGEAGHQRRAGANLTARVTWFDNRVKNPVSNVTLIADAGAEAEPRPDAHPGRADRRRVPLGASWRVAGAYLYNQAKVTDGGVANAGLVGKYLPQVPKHRGSVQVSYANPEGRHASRSACSSQGAQFNDDQNVNFIPAATLTEAGYDADTPPAAGLYRRRSRRSRDLGRGSRSSSACRTCSTRSTSCRRIPSTIGTPRLVNGGVRVRFAGGSAPARAAAVPYRGRRPPAPR